MPVKAKHLTFGDYAIGMIDGKAPSGMVAMSYGDVYDASSYCPQANVIVGYPLEVAIEAADEAGPHSEVTAADLELPEAYESRQRKWVDLHGIKEGSKLRVSRTARDGEGGWRNSWCHYEMPVDDVIKVARVRPSGIRSSTGYCYPYFVLEPVNE